MQYTPSIELLLCVRLWKEYHQIDLFEAIDIIARLVKNKRLLVDHRDGGIAPVEDISHVLYAMVKQSQRDVKQLEMGMMGEFCVKQINDYVVAPDNFLACLNESGRFDTSEWLSKYRELKADSLSLHESSKDLSSIGKIDDILSSNYQSKEIEILFRGIRKFWLQDFDKAVPAKRDDVVKWFMAQGLKNRLAMAAYTFTHPDNLAYKTPRKKLNLKTG
jgi:hypothetical protein